MILHKYVDSSINVFVKKLRIFTPENCELSNRNWNEVECKKTVSRISFSDPPLDCLESNFLFHCYELCVNQWQNYCWMVKTATRNNYHIFVIDSALSNCLKFAMHHVRHSLCDEFWKSSIFTEACYEDWYISNLFEYMKMIIFTYGTSRCLENTLLRLRHSKKVFVLKNTHKHERIC